MIAGQPVLKITWYRAWQQPRAPQSNSPYIDSVPNGGHLIHVILGCKRGQDSHNVQVKASLATVSGFKAEPSEICSYSEKAGCRGIAKGPCPWPCATRTARLASICKVGEVTVAAVNRTTDEQVRGTSKPCQPRCSRLMRFQSVSATKLVFELTMHCFRC